VPVFEQTVRNLESTSNLRSNTSAGYEPRLNSAKPSPVRALHTLINVPRTEDVAIRVPSLLIVAQLSYSLCALTSSCFEMINIDFGCTVESVVALEEASS
jgi:hypothetical protein